MRKVIIALLLLVTAFPLKAQNNNYGVKDALAPLCEKIENNKYSPNASYYIDSLINKARQYHDIEAEAFAYMIRVEAEYATNRPDFDRHCEITQRFAREHHLPRYYYRTAFYMIKRLSLSNKELSAFQESNRYLQQAIKEKYAYGKALMLQTFAESKYIHGEFMSAIPLFREALKFELENIHEPDMDIYNTYMQLGRCYLYSCHYQEAEPCFLEGLKTCKIPKATFECHALLAQVAFMLGQKDKFMKYYHMMESASGDMKMQFSRYGTRVKIYHLLLEGKTEEAYKTCMSMDNKRVRDAFLCDYYEYLRDYKNTLSMTKSLRGTYTQSNTLARRKDIASFISEQDNVLLNMEANQLELANNQLSLRNTNVMLENASLELARTRSEELADQVLTNNAQLLLNKRNAELRRSKIESESMKQMREEETAHSTFYRNMLVIVLHFLILVVCILVFLFYRHRRSSRILKQKNAELEEAFTHAKEAEVLKDKYISTTGRELKSALKTLSSLSDQISADRILSVEEKEQLSNDIQKNSDLIIQLLDREIKV